MKNKLCIAIVFVTALLVSSSCETIRKTSLPATADTSPTQPTEQKVEAEPEVISIAEAEEIFEHPEKTTAIAKKYGYKLKTGYEIYRLDKFSKMYYKNCRLAKILTGTLYEDYPKPLRKGISSYMAFKDGAMIIGVFNQRVYDNLVAQVKAAGYVLDMPGNEDIYVKGSRTIACYAGAKTVRVQ
ncbi:hypothetical protein ETF27_07145 [Prevotella brunnea]|uniref:Lipoprotein n=1 Tax=Prevotella brunnea TaxID=2508867 RepID=A0A5C8GIG7_9BACT|nr:hypothetical protein [Prevotella brunnea]TXJ61629.1 hypothetical protein ETF27_07145 [Prevotella brunnea]